MKNSLLISLVSSLLLSTTVFAIDYSNVDTIKQVQEALNTAGYNCGTPDGIVGSGTKAQIEKYRVDNELDINDNIDENLYSSLFFSYNFKSVTSDEEIASIPEIKVLAGVIAKHIQELNLGKCTFVGMGNLSSAGNMVFVDAKYTTAEGKPIIFSNMYSPYNTPYVWSVHSISNQENDHYYYLDEVFSGDYDIYDYSTEEIIEHAIEIHIPTDEEKAEEAKKKEEIESFSRNIITSELYDTDIQRIDVNRTTSGTYIVLPHLTWNVKNSKNLTNTMLERYSLTFAKLLSEEYQDIEEIACFWTVPYISETLTAKFQYFRNDGVMYVGDIAIGWGEE